MSIPSQGGFISPVKCLSFLTLAVKKSYRQAVPHFAVVKRIDHSERRSRSSSSACPLPTSPQPSTRASHKHAVLIAHWIRQVPVMCAEVVCTMGRELCWASLIWATAQHRGVSCSALGARATLDEVVATSLRQLSRVSNEDNGIVGEQDFATLARLLPARAVFVCAARWVHQLLVADEIQIVRWLRSRQPEKWWAGMISRIATSAISGVAENSITLLLCVTAWFPQGRSVADQSAPPSWSFADASTMVGKQQILCAIGAAMASATIRSYIIPRASTLLQRILLWCFEEIEYIAMRRYADVGRHCFDDVDESLLTEDEWRTQNAKREALQRSAVLRAVAMRSAAWIVTRVVLLHPLSCVMQILNSMAVLWTLGIAAPCAGNRVLIGLAAHSGWTVWSYEQLQLEALNFGNVLAETSRHSFSLMMGDGNVVQSFDVLLRRVGALEPLYRGWQWTLLASLATIHVSTIGRITSTLF